MPEFSSEITKTKLAARLCVGDRAPVYVTLDLVYSSYKPYDVTIKIYCTGSSLPKGSYRSSFTVKRLDLAEHLVSLSPVTSNRFTLSVDDKHDGDVVFEYTHHPIDVPTFSLTQISSSALVHFMVLVNRFIPAEVITHEFEVISNPESRADLHWLTQPPSA